METEKEIQNIMERLEHTFLWHLLRQKRKTFASLRTKVMPLLGYAGRLQK